MTFKNYVTTDVFHDSQRDNEDMICDVWLVFRLIQTIAKEYIDLDSHYLAYFLSTVKGHNLRYKSEKVDKSLVFCFCYFHPATNMPDSKCRLLKHANKNTLRQVLSYSDTVPLPTY